MTFPEMLDNAENGEEFGKVIQGLFGFLEQKMADNEELQYRFDHQEETNEGAINELMEEME